MGGGYSKTVKSTVVVNIGDLVGKWVEVGRYTDPEEALCNNVELNFFADPNPSEMTVGRTCICQTVEGTAFTGAATGNKIQTRHFIQTKVSNTFDILETKQKITVVYFQRGWLLLADPDHLWIYQKGSITMDKTKMAELFNIVQGVGYDPSRVILTGKSVQALAAQQIFTGTILYPQCAGRV
jgi:lipocalin